MIIFQKRMKTILFVMIGLHNTIGLAEIQWGTCFMKPFFVSKWIMMIAQDNSHSEIEIKHGLNEWPAIVEIQIKPSKSDGNNVLVFKGTGAALIDNNHNSTFGGIVYIYDKIKIKLFAPNKRDGTGAIISTGDSPRRDERTLNENEVMVRTRIWRYKEVPKPDFETDWMYFSSANSSLLEFDHKLNKEPEYISVQVKLGSTELISDGIGMYTSPEGRKTSTKWGAVGYAYNNNKIRIWIPYSQYNGGIFSADVSGKNSSLLYKYGELKIRAWLSLKAKQTTNNNEILYFTKENPVIRVFKTSTNQDVDIVNLMVKETGVDNSGFIFPVSGSVQHNITSSNYRKGLIYAYSDNYYKLWFVQTKRGGSSIQHDIIQRGSKIRNNIHEIDSVNIVIYVWKPYEICHSTSTVFHKRKMENSSTNTLVNNESASTIYMSSTDAMTAETTNTIRVSYTTPVHERGSISGTLAAVIVTIGTLVSLAVVGIIIKVSVKLKRRMILTPYSGGFET